MYLRAPPPDEPDKYRNVSLIPGRNRPAGRLVSDKDSRCPGLPGAPPSVPEGFPRADVWRQTALPARQRSSWVMLPRQSVFTLSDSPRSSFG